MKHINSRVCSMTVEDATKVTIQVADQAAFLVARAAAAGEDGEEREADDCYRAAIARFKCLDYLHSLAFVTEEEIEAAIKREKKASADG